MEGNYTLIKTFFMSLSLTIALVMLNTPFWLISIATLFLFSPLFFSSFAYATLVQLAYDLGRPILYIWALVVTIQGKQDFIAIAFYILIALQITTIVKRCVGTLILLFHK